METLKNNYEVLKNKVLKRYLFLTENKEYDFTSNFINSREDHERETVINLIEDGDYSELNEYEFKDWLLKLIYYDRNGDEKSCYLLGISKGSLFVLSDETDSSFFISFSDLYDLNTKINLIEEMESLNNIQTEILKSIDTSSIIAFLKEHRGAAFILWSQNDIIGKASEMGFKMSVKAAQEIITKLNKEADCNTGISWDTISSYIDEWILKNSFDVKLDVSGDECEVKFCSLKTHENIVNYWNDDLYYYYGLSKNEVKKFVGTDKMIGDAKVISVT